MKAVQHAIGKATLFSQKGKPPPTTKTTNLC